MASPKSKTFTIPEPIKVRSRVSEYGAEMVQPPAQDLTTPIGVIRAGYTRDHRRFLDVGSRALTINGKPFTLDGRVCQDEKTKAWKPNGSDDCFVVRHAFGSNRIANDEVHAVVLEAVSAALASVKFPEAEPASTRELRILSNKIAQTQSRINDRWEGVQTSLGYIQEYNDELKALLAEEAKLLKAKKGSK